MRIMWIFDKKNFRKEYFVLFMCFLVIIRVIVWKILFFYKCFIIIYNYKTHLQTGSVFGFSGFGKVAP